MPLLKQGESTSTTKNLVYDSTCHEQFFLSDTARAETNRPKRAWRVRTYFFLHISCIRRPRCTKKIDFCFFRRKETTRTDRTHSRPSPRVVLPTNRAWIANSSKTTLLAAKKSGPPRRVVAPMFTSIELDRIKSSTKQTVLHSLQMKRASRNSTTNGNGFLGRYHVLLSGLHPSDAGGSNCSFFECLVSRSIRIASNRSAPRRSSSRQACACVSKHRFPKTLTRGSHFSHVRGSKPKDTNFCFRAATTRSLLAMVSKQGARACCVGI